MTHMPCEFCSRPHGPESVKVCRRNLYEQRQALLAACKKALHLVEENNQEIVEMVTSFGLYADLRAAVAKAEGGEG